MFSVWNEKNNIFSEKHDRVCLKHKVCLYSLQRSGQTTPHSLKVAVLMSVPPQRFLLQPLPLPFRYCHE